MDNKATISEAENTNSAPRACNINIKHGWVSQLVEEGFLKILLVQSTDNPLDQCTKNASPEVCNAHAPHRLEPRESYRFGLDNEEVTEEQGDEVIHAQEDVGDESHEQFSPKL